MLEIIELYQNFHIKKMVHLKDTQGSIVINFIFLLF